MSTPALTPRQHEILTLMARGLTAPEIAGELVLGRDTVRTHQRVIYRTLNVHTGPAAVAAGYRVGLLNDHAVRWEHSMSDEIASWLKRTLQQLHDTERDLGEERQRGAALIAENGTLKQRLAAAELRIADLQSAGAPEIACGELLWERPVKVVPVGDLL